MTTITQRHRRRSAVSDGAIASPRPLRIHLAQLDEDQASLDRARQLLQQGRQLSAAQPRDAYELVHRAALRGAGVLVTRANRERKRKLPLNVWKALERIGGRAAERAAELTELVAERERLSHDPSAQPDALLLERHLEHTQRHLDQIAEQLLSELPGRLTALAG